MKTVKGVSLLLDVSTTTVYNHIEKLGNIITPYIFYVKGVQYLNTEGSNPMQNGAIDIFILLLLKIPFKTT